MPATKKKSLRPYLKFLIGYWFSTPWGYMRLTSVTSDRYNTAWFQNDFYENVPALTKHNVRGRSFPLTKIKPLVLPMKELTRELMSKCEASAQDIEKTDTSNPSPFDGTYPYVHLNAERIVYLVEKQLDVFNLLKHGLAIDKNTVDFTDKK